MVLFNHFVEDFTVRAGDWIAQLVLERIETPQVKKVAALDNTDYGARGFGSTSTKQLTQSSPSKIKRVQRKRIVYPISKITTTEAENSVHMVVNTEPGPSSTSWLARGSTAEQEVVSRDDVSEGRL